MARMIRGDGVLWAVLMMALPSHGVQAAPVSDVPTVHGISLYDTPALPDDFDHFPWVNAQAPKGGDMVRAALGSFDSLNPFIVRGNPADGLTSMGGLPFDTLMVESPGEPFTLYGLLAAGIRLDPDRRWMEIDLDARARFHDGSPVTANDVVTTFKTLRTMGSPMYRAYYADVIRVERLSPLTVRFEFSEHNSRELPLILGQLPVLSAKDVRNRDITRPTLAPLMGSGPYRITSVQPGQRIVYQRDDSYWGKDLPVNKGRYNIDRLIFDYYRDPSVALTAFRAGRVDLRVETIARNWVTGYDFPAARQGLIKRVEVEDHNPAPMQGFVMNQRREIFKDRRVRQALGLAFDFEWLNRNLFYGLYARTRGFFDHSTMEATGTPSIAECALLSPWRHQLPEEVFESPLPIEAPEALRPRLKKALALLNEAGYEVTDDRMINRETGRPLRFELLLSDARLERMALPMVRNLARLGVEVNLRTVDSSQYLVRMRQFDFDMTTTVIAQSNSPGNEQREYWGSEYADQPQSRNLIGLKSPVIDDLVNHIIRADSRKALNTAAAALDRVLRWGFYVIPQYHSPVTRLAYWKKIAMPDQSPEYGLDLDSWWVDSQGTGTTDALQE